MLPPNGRPTSDVPGSGLLLAEAPNPTWGGAGFGTARLCAKFALAPKTADKCPTGGGAGDVPPRAALTI